MRNKLIYVWAASVLAAYAQSFQQQTFSQQGFTQPSVSHRVDLPGDAPVSLAGDEWGGSAAVIRGGAYQIDVRVSLSLRNAGQRRIRGITLTVTAGGASQDAVAGGRGSISVPGLDAGPGDTFTVRGDLHLLRPIGSGGGPLVEVGLDGILFDDLNFYGPDKLHSRRSLMVWELEARRDRRYFKGLLDGSGSDALRDAMLASLARDGNRPRANVQSVRGSATNFDAEREVKFAFFKFPNAPLEPVDGLARVAGNEARSPKLVVRNKSLRPVRFFELGWIVRDQQGREFLAASVPSDMRLLPRSSAQIVPEAALRFDPRTTIEGMTAYVSQVEFADGTLWIPSREELDEPTLRRLTAPSPEEQRLVQIYSKRGLNAVIAELKKDEPKKDELRKF